MNKIRVDKKYRFVSAFDDKTGMYVRTGIIKNGKDSGIDPFMASFPHLVDVGIMGHCEHGKTGLCNKAGIGCYQSGAHIRQPNMTLADFSQIVSQCAGNVDQFALGGRGDPDMHENFEEILALCRNNGIVPNFTTSGFGLTKKAAGLCGQYCGAVAVSWYRSDYTHSAIQMLLEAGVKTNIHYVLAGSTINEAIERLESSAFPRGINAVLFLLHKPIGQGSQEDVLAYDDERVSRFFAMMDKGGLPFKFGIDSCTTPGVINYCKNVSIESIDTCEGGRFSCYISPDMKMLPCSFDQSSRFEVSLRDHAIQEAWDSKAFADFRETLKTACADCNDQADCKGGCPLLPEIVLCKRAVRC